MIHHVQSYISIAFILVSQYFLFPKDSGQPVHIELFSQVKMSYPSPSQLPNNTDDNNSDPWEAYRDIPHLPGLGSLLKFPVKVDFILVKHYREICRDILLRLNVK